MNGGFGITESTAIDFGVSWLDSEGFPTRTTDDTDRGYENLSANLRRAWTSARRNSRCDTGARKARPNIQISS